MAENKCEITNMDYLGGPKDQVQYKNNPFMPSVYPYRWLICGTSGSGKTNMLGNVLLKGWINYDKIAIYAPSLNDNATYKYITEQLEQVAAQNDTPKSQLIMTGTSIDDIPPVEDFENGLRNIIIFDDMLTEKNQKIIETYFTRGRHKGLCVFYLSQTYFDTPKLVRRNCNVVSLFNMDGREVGELSRNIGMSDKKKLMKYYKEATQKPHGFLHIDQTQSFDWAKYRNGLDGFFCDNIPESMRDLLAYCI